MRYILLSMMAFLMTGSVHADEIPRLQPNNSWISIDGTVESVSPDKFLLDYGKGSVTVEMDDGDRDADAYKLLPGDKVQVSGVIDADLFEKTTIEASSVYVEKLNTYFFASAADEEDVYTTMTLPVVVSNVVVRGEVKDVSGDEFTLETGDEKINVDTDAMPYDPLDDIGYQQIEKGDVVSVTGRMDNTFITGRELIADSVTTLSER